MVAGVLTGWRGLRHLGNRGYLYVWANLFWAVLTLLIITAPAAWAGLARLNYVLLRHSSATMDDFWQGVRENLPRTLPLGLLNALIVIMTTANLITYSGQEGIGIIVLRLVWACSLLAWILVQYFGWAFFYIMEQPTWIGALRNAMLMILRYPGFVLGVMMIVIVTGIGSSLLPGAWLLLTGSAFAAIAGTAVQDRLRFEGIDRSAPLDEGIYVDPSIHDV